MTAEITIGVSAVDVDNNGDGTPTINRFWRLRHEGCSTPEELEQLLLDLIDPDHTRGGGKATHGITVTLESDL